MVLISLGLLSSCAEKPIYYWGNYESSLYRTMVKGASPSEEILSLKSDISDARKGKLPLPPGFHAHLGYLYYSVGEMVLAQEEFRNELDLFPESKVLIDRLLHSPQKREVKNK